MEKLNFTREELEAKYRKKLDVFLDDFDWITHVNGYMICSLVVNSLKDFKIEIATEELYKRYNSKVKSLELGDEQWRNTYGITEIIGLLYNLIEEF